MNWVEALKGQLAISSIHELRLVNKDNCDVVVSLVRQGEGPILQLGVQAESRGVLWFHRPLQFQGHNPPETYAARSAISCVNRYLNEGLRVFVHCSQGIHRSGLVCYCALRMGGLSDDRSVETIALTRPPAANALTDRVRSMYRQLVSPAERSI